MENRPTVRIILLNQLNQILLIQYHARAFLSEPLNNKGLPTQPFWMTPGGGIDSGESPLKALIRELKEETGIVEKEILKIHPTPAWYREAKILKENRSFLFLESYYVVRVYKPVICSNVNPDEEEKANILSLRWWTYEELSNSSITILPRDLPQLLPSLLHQDPLHTLMIH